MKYSIALTIAMFAIALDANASETASLAEKPLPNFSIQNASGEVVTLSSEAKRQPVVLFFWASWCPYCKALMPHLQSMVFEYGDDVKIIAVQFKDKNDGKAFIDEAGYDFMLIPNGDKIADLYDVFGTPGLIIVDAERMSRFDLRDLPALDSGSKKQSHKTKAAKRAPYWAAAIRKNIDAVLAD